MEHPTAVQQIRQRGDATRDLWPVLRKHLILLFGLNHELSRPVNHTYSALVLKGTFML